MKKIFLIIVMFFSVFTLVGCGQDEEALKLTNKEKFELIQEMESPDFKVTQMKMELDLYGSGEGQVIDIYGKINTYQNMTDTSKIINYIDFDIDAKTPEGNILGVGSLYLNNEEAYLDLNASLKVGGSTTKVESKEVMPLDILGLDFTNLPMDEIFPWDSFQEIDYTEVKDELDSFLDFVSVYKDGSTTRFAVSLTTAKLLTIDEIKNNPDAMEVINSIDPTSKISFSIIYNNKKLSKMVFNINFKMDYEGVEVDCTGKIELIINGATPQLPTTSQLSKYEEVEVFSFLEDLMPQEPYFPSY